MRSIPREPATILYNERIYRLAKAWQQLDEVRSEGPFYSTAGVEPEDWAFLPDAYFLWAEIAPISPSSMHCIQQRSHAKTPRPKFHVEESRVSESFKPSPK